MKTTILYAPKRYKIISTEEQFDLPISLRQRIDESWKIACNNNHHLENNDMHSIKEIKYENETIIFILNKTNYSHFLYSLNNEIDDEYMCRPIYVSSFIRTLDGYYIFGRMSSHTSFPEVIQCIGGSIDKEDIVNNVLNPFLTMKRETYEETGIKIDNKEIIKEVYFINRDKMSNLGICIRININKTKSQVLETFRKHLLKQDYNELSDLVLVNKDNKSIREFLNDKLINKVDYLNDLLNVEFNFISTISFNKYLMQLGIICNIRES